MGGSQPQAPERKLSDTLSAIVTASEARRVPRSGVTIVCEMMRSRPTSDSSSAKPALGGGGRLGPLALDELEAARRGNQEIHLVTVMVPIEVDLTATALVREVPDDLAEHVRLEERAQHRASKEIVRVRAPSRKLHSPVSRK